MDPRLDRLHRVAAARGGVLSLAGGLPAPELLPRDAIAAATLAALPDTAAAIGADDVVITAGAQQALSLIAGLWPAGTRIAVERETYPAALETFALAGHQVVTSGAAELHYLIDGVSNPHGVDRVGPRRAALLAGGAPLIVDEAYVELRFDGRVARPLCADAPERVWQLGSFSKVVSPGLRIGWLIAPRAHRAALLARKQAADLQTGGFAQAVLGRWLADADYDGVVARARNLYGARAERLTSALRRHLPGWHATVPEGGFSTWVETDLAGDEVDVVAAAVAHGVVVDPGSMFRAIPDPDAPAAFRLSFSHIPPASLDEAVQRLARAARAYRHDHHAHAA